MSLTLRDITPEDHEALIALWIAAWAPVLPQIDFVARQGFIGERLVDYLIPPKRARVLEENGVFAGFSLIEALVVILIFWPGMVTYWLEKPKIADPSKIELKLPQIEIPTLNLPGLPK